MIIKRYIGILITCFLCLPATAQSADIEAGKKVFNQVCAYCHLTTYDDKFGPGLAGIMERQTTEWLNKFLLDPAEMIRTDEYTKSLVESNDYKLLMPALPQMKDDVVRANVIAYMGTLE